MNSKPKTIHETPNLQKKRYHQDDVLVEEYATMNDHTCGGTVSADVTRIVPLTGKDPTVLDIAVKDAQGRSLGSITFDDECQLVGFIDMLSWFSREHFGTRQRPEKGGAR